MSNPAVFVCHTHTHTHTYSCDRLQTRCMLVITDTQSYQVSVDSASTRMLHIDTSTGTRRIPQEPCACHKGRTGIPSIPSYPEKVVAVHDWDWTSHRANTHPMNPAIKAPKASATQSRMMFYDASFLWVQEHHRPLSLLQSRC